MAFRLTRHRGAQPGPVNLGNPQEITVNDLVSNVLHLTGSSSEIARHPLPVDDPQRRKPDIRKARELLGWEPKVPLMEGLRRTIAWFEQEQDGRAKPQRWEARRGGKAWVRTLKARW